MPQYYTVECVKNMDPVRDGKMSKKHGRNERSMHTLILFGFLGLTFLALIVDSLVGHEEHFSFVLFLSFAHCKIIVN